MDLINLLNEIGGPQKCCIKIIEKNKSTKKQEREKAIREKAI